MLPSTPACAEILQIGIELALTPGTQASADSPFGKPFGSEKPLHGTPTHVQLPGNRSLSHARTVQRQDVLVALIALVSANLLLAFRVGQGRQFHLLIYQRRWQ